MRPTPWGLRHEACAKRPALWGQHHGASTMEPAPWSQHHGASTMGPAPWVLRGSPTPNQTRGLSSPVEGASQQNRVEADGPGSAVCDITTQQLHNSFYTFPQYWHKTVVQVPSPSAHSPPHVSNINQERMIKTCSM
uniref:Uncharacterized protein n=1 Tax=Knipowitschia caucasica TaxID=637954 RepID=A0AAV2M130_KNICA